MFSDFRTFLSEDVNVPYDDGEVGGSFGKWKLEYEQNTLLQRREIPILVSRNGLGIS
jgi:hypothetical protein